MLSKVFILVVIIMKFGLCYENENKMLKLSITVSAKLRNLELSWSNALINSDDIILLTNQKPHKFDKIKSNCDIHSVNQTVVKCNTEEIWICNNSNNSILLSIIPTLENDWITTKIPFNFSLLKEITIQTDCYGYWLSYLRKDGTLISQNCMRAHATWMNDLKNKIGEYTIRDLFIPGTHNSGSYRLNFDPKKNETLVTKYTLTQDDDIHNQLIHGIRYLDIRIGCYKASSEFVWVNHGIARQRPLKEILDQVREFVIETNEIIIFDIQEFPVGFGKTLEIHRKLVHYLINELKDFLVDPTQSWKITLNNIWARKQNILLCYDKADVVEEFSLFLFQSVEQKWGNVHSLPSLTKFLTKVNQERVFFRDFSDRPIADMAEMTPNKWSILFQNGLRTMADKVNRHISKQYRESLASTANIVAVDFYRGTDIVDTALSINIKRN